MTDGLSEALAAIRRGELTYVQRVARAQQQLAADGCAAGQCASCGSYTADGSPPILHRTGCPKTCNCDGEWWGGEHVSDCPLGPTRPRHGRWRDDLADPSWIPEGIRNDPGVQWSIAKDRNGES